MEFKGILKEKMPMQQGEKNGKTWQSRQFRVETLEQYPQIAVFDLFGDKCDLIEKIPLGVAITVHYNFKATENNGRWWNKINAWKIESDFKTSAQQITTATEPANDKPFEEKPDLPF